jgi:FMN-dependent oxidoreductase (nitrilotriacetate monooxygenase family)
MQCLERATLKNTMTTPKKRLHLGLFLDPQGYHVAGWRHPDTTIAPFATFKDYHAVVDAAEKARFDFVFMADTMSVREKDPRIACQTAGAGVATLEPLTLMAALAVSTQHIGLIATASTTYNEPFNLARKFASIDHLSGGRAGWNLITTNSDVEALNFNLAANPLHEERYARAREFADVVTGLWDSWDDAAFTGSKTEGFHTQPTHLRELNYAGKHFTVRGPLNMARPPQGHPIIVQAGSSEPGRELAAQSADIVFTAQPLLAEAKAFYQDQKARAVRYGRDPDSLKILPGLFVVVAETTEKAHAIYRSLQDLIPIEVALARLSGQLGGVDLSGYPIDGPLPDLPETNGPKSRQKILIDAAKRDNLTIRELALHNSGSRGHLTLIGNPVEIADIIEDWFVNAGADGFNIMIPHLPTGLTLFTTLVIPELQRRGLFPTDYAGKTFRDNLGLTRPLSRKE